jgi:hypothetical protein
MAKTVTKEETHEASELLLKIWTNMTAGDLW